MKGGIVVGITRQYFEGELKDGEEQESSDFE